jgi:glycosyltransferase involved in cell wall biosynthesis
MGWRIELVIPETIPASFNSPPAEPDHAEDPPIHRLPVKGSNSRLWSFIGLRHLLDARRPRIVYIENEPDSAIAWSAGRWCARHGAKLIVNSAENDIPPVLSALLQRGLKPALRSLRTRLWLMGTRRYVSHVVAICAGGREAMETVGFRGAVTVTPVGFDPRRFHTDERERADMRARLGLRDVAVSYFGRLAPNKGVHILIEALAKIRHLPWHFIIDDFLHASSDYALQLRHLIDKSGIADRTIFITAKHGEIADFMRAADIVVLPSTWREQYGRVAPEAMACGCTVVVAASGALPELVGDAGVTTSPGDVSELARVLENLIGDPERRRRLGRAGAARAREYFSLDRQASLLDSLFRDSLDGRRR